MHYEKKLILRKYRAQTFKLGVCNCNLRNNSIGKSLNLCRTRNVRFRNAIRRNYNFSGFSIVNNVYIDSYTRINVDPFHFVIINSSQDEKNTSSKKRFKSFFLFFFFVFSQQADFGIGQVSMIIIIIYYHCVRYVYV